MAPSTASTPTGVLFEDDPVETLEASLNNDHEQIEPPKRVKEYRRQIVWKNVILFTTLFLASLYGGYLMITNTKLLTFIWAFLLYVATGIGITAGAHRLWAHRSYKARWPLKVILIIFNTIAFQNHVYEWARDHRVHHKYTETNADPHNAKRGFFFSHVGWLLCRKHPDVIAKGKGIDMSDLLQDSFVAFQKKYYLILMPLFCFIIPTLVPVYCWGETYLNAYFVAALFRYFFTLNVTWLVNSAAHMWGNRPYDQYINPAENRSVSVFALGEGWHNYHHVFPWDYKTSELKIYGFNFTTAFIDFFAKLGWAYDLKTVSPEMIQRRVERTGDGSHAIWGWGDKDIPTEDIQEATIINPDKEEEAVSNKKDD